MKVTTVTPQDAGTLTVSGSRVVPAPRPRVTSRELLDGGNELVIDHDGQEYRLRLTRNGKLILNK
jgi:hemin uptake protein HemP